MKLVCTNCGLTQEQTYRPVCGWCDALTNPVYELDTARLRKSDNPYERFFDLLPVRERELLPAEGEYTPTIHAANLGRRLGLPHLYLKNETVLPTGTTKYRMATIALAYLCENGVWHFCTSSTGNSSTAYATLIPSFPDLKLTLFTAESFRHRVNLDPASRVEHFILRGATFAEAFNVAGKYANDHGFTSERGFFNAGRREGLKLAFMEATEQVPRTIDWYVQAVSSGMGVYGTRSGARELLALDRIERVPRLLAVQQETCSPMVRAWTEGFDHIAERHIFPNPHGIAEAILRGDPRRVYPYMRGIVDETGGEFVAVSEHEIRSARQTVMDDEGVDICFSAATAVAGLMRAVRNEAVPRDETVLVNLSGSDRPVATGCHGTLVDKVEGDWRVVI